MKLLFDLFPVILFFATFKYGESHAAELARYLQQSFGGEFDPSQAPILAATVVAVLASIVQVGITLAKGKRPEVMHWISLGIIVVFGSLTIWLHNEMFIKWKPTILYWVFATILVFGTLTGKNFMIKLMGKSIQLPMRAWDAMQKAWIVFFSLVGALNLVVAYLFETATWVNFKLFGLLGLTLMFTLGIGVWVAKLTQNNENNDTNS
ncbi:MAG: septation protein A [Duodenibacillus sp.]|nr:septation protein A [Duodenibacillus sp.]